MADQTIFAKVDPLVRAKMEETMKAMATINPEEILEDHRPFLVVYKDGRIHRFLGLDTVPAGVDPITGVESKDVVVSPENSEVFVRLYKPPNPNKKLPLLVYFHGGGFCIETASSPAYHLHLNALSSQSNAVIASVNYRLAPEHPLPTAYDDCWTAIKWIANGGDGDTWLRDYVDYSRVFFGGDSAGGNIAHHMAKRVRTTCLDGVHLYGVVLVHPYFWGEERIGSEKAKIESKVVTGTADKLWRFVCPGTTGSDDPLINPGMDPELGNMGAERVLVLVAEHDALRDRGFHYKEALEKSGWKGTAEVVEAVGENHVFHLFNPTGGSATELMNRIVGFINSN